MPKISFVSGFLVRGSKKQLVRAHNLHKGRPGLADAFVIVLRQALRIAGGNHLAQPVLCGNAASRAVLNHPFHCAQRLGHLEQRVLRRPQKHHHFAGRSHFEASGERFDYTGATQRP